LLSAPDDLVRDVAEVVTDALGVEEAKGLLGWE
jgi:hypothetical protein